MPSSKKIILVEDELAHKELIFRAFEADDDITMIWARSLAEAKQLIADVKPDLVISDWRLTDGSGMDLLLSPRLEFPTILMTSFGNEELAVQSMKAGVMDYLVKSPEAFENLPQNVRRVLREWDNIIARQNAEKRVEEIAFFDLVTGLPNRAQFVQKLGQTLAACSDDRRGMLFYIDIDNFKIINDTFGHSWGDRCLIEVSNMLSQLTVPEKFVCRLGGDEFVLIVDGVDETTDAISVAEQIMECFRVPLAIDETRFYLTISMGIVVYPADGTTVDEIFKNADAAMYQSKGKGKNNYTLFDKVIHQSIFEKMTMGNLLRTAIANHELRLYYQPQVKLATGQICGLEALIRWDSPCLGFVSPLRFIRLAEEMGLIVSIGYWVIRQACTFAKLLSNRYPDIYISINLSNVQLMQIDFVDRVQAIIQEVGILPSMIRMEITESLLMESFESSLEQLHKLKQFGLNIELDDFGTGYSSLNYLKRLPITTVKIDKSFIDDIVGEGKETDITDLIVRLAHRLNLAVVAEGVETLEQMDLLGAYNCDIVQGYLISKPLPEADVEEFLQSYSKGDGHHRE